MLKNVLIMSTFFYEYPYFIDIMLKCYFFTYIINKKKVNHIIIRLIKKIHPIYIEKYSP
jgi:hypothetical protein